MPVPFEHQLYSTGVMKRVIALSFRKLVKWGKVGQQVLAV